nr:hypothetical protein [Tanacetum cinerariifolium]
RAQAQRGNGTAAVNGRRSNTVDGGDDDDDYIIRTDRLALHHNDVAGEGGKPAAAIGKGKGKAKSRDV